MDNRRRATTGICIHHITEKKIMDNISGTITHKDSNSLTVKDKDNKLWTVNGLQPIYDGAIGLTKTLGRKCFIGYLADCGNREKNAEEGQETYIVVRTPLQQLTDEEYSGLEATLFVMG